MRQLLTKGISLAAVLASSALPCFAIGGFAVTNVPVSYFAGWSAESNVKSLVGDYDGDGMSDIALTGNSSWSSVPVAVSNGDGTFQIINASLSYFPTWAAYSGAKPLVGDFNGDGRTDLALLGPAAWNFVPMAFANGDGTFTPTVQTIGLFAGWASYADTKILVGDFNGDGKADIALTGHAGWGSVPVAFSNGDGTFNVTNESVLNFPGWAASANVEPLVGDFNHDGKADIALTGNPDWGSVPVAFSNGNGTFSVTNEGVLSFPAWSSQAGVRHWVGDFNHDGRTDIALTGDASWAAIPIAFSNGNGGFSVTKLTFPNSGNFAAWTSDTNARVLVGDFNGDGRTDIVATGDSSWYFMVAGFSLGNGTFAVNNVPVVGFGGWSPLANPYVGDYNGDGKADVALAGNSAWGSVPVAFSLTPAN